MRLVGVMSVALRLKSPSIADLDEMSCAKILYTCFNLVRAPDRLGFQKCSGKELK